MTDQPGSFFQEVQDIDEVVTKNFVFLRLKVIKKTRILSRADVVAWQKMSTMKIECTLPGRTAACYNRGQVQG